jgi:prepilin-type N-terminal cleavage/methylation domain-containing protein/prepilin-type processing-associated H-X9-DG protein
MRRFRDAGEHPGQVAGVRPAFTLIEILVVVALIALLISILLPSLARAREQARTTVCRSNMRQVMAGHLLYVYDHKRLAATHSLFYEQNLFPSPAKRCWPLPAGKTWDGARGGTAYPVPIHTSADFIRDTPRTGTVFRYVVNEKVYVCPSDRPGAPEDSVLGGGGNGRLTFSMNAYIAYKKPEDLARFTYVAPVNRPLPGGGSRSFQAGQRMVWSASDFFVLVEEHPWYALNRSPEGNFNTHVDRIVTRHSWGIGSITDPKVTGRTNIAFLDGHVATKLYPVTTTAQQLFAELGQPEDDNNLRAFMFNLQGWCP